jgi:hypothetical protein
MPTQGNAVTHGELNALLTAIKNEFARRANPYSKERLDKYLSSTSVSDGAGVALSASETNKVLKAIRML